MVTHCWWFLVLVLPQIEVPLLPEGASAPSVERRARKSGGHGPTPTSSSSKDAGGDTQQTQSQDLGDATASAPSYVDKDSRIFERFDFSYIQEFMGVCAMLVKGSLPLVLWLHLTSYEITVPHLLRFECYCTMWFVFCIYLPMFPSLCLPLASLTWMCAACRG